MTFDAETQHAFIVIGLLFLAGIVGLMRAFYLLGWQRGFACRWTIRASRSCDNSACHRL